MDGLDALLNQQVLGLRVGDIGAAALAILLGFVAAKIVEVIVAMIRNRMGEGTLRHAVFDALIKPAGWAPMLAGIWFAANLFPIPPVRGDGGEVVFDLGNFVSRIFLGATVVLVMWFGVRLTDGMTRIWAQYAAGSEGTFDDQLVPIVRKSVKTTLIVVGAVMIVQNLGYSVTSLIAGIGLGGAALALASKDTVANLFGSLVIFIDRPFQIGDWVEIGDVEGTVEEVGLRVTLIRTFANSLITVPNAQLTTTAINNWSRMRKRRIKLTLGLTYDAKPAQVEQAVEAIRTVLREDERIDQSFFLVHFTDLGASSLDIFVYCFTITTAWGEHLQVRQEVLLKFMKAIEALGLEFAFPTQTIHVDGLDRPGAAPPGMQRKYPA